MKEENKGELEMDEITSIKNQRAKEWKKLLTKKGRKKANQYMIEGFHLIEEAISFDTQIREVIIREDVLTDQLTLPNNAEIISVSKEVADEISDTETNQGIFAIIDFQDQLPAISYENPFLFLDEIQDPGNLGTLIRTADAAGFSGVVVGEGTVDPYNPKTLRSAQGSHFHQPIFSGSLEGWISEFKKRHIPVYGTDLNKNSVSYKEIEQTNQFALIVGNEGNGVNQHILDLSDINLHIPMKGQAESLNVAIAASILMFSLST